jgi:SNF2 family DNA or RNA helicase
MFLTSFGAVDTSRRLIVVKPNEARLTTGVVERKVLPDGRIVVRDDYWTVRTLNHNGADLEMPALRYYDFGSHKPYAVQLKTIDMLHRNSRAYVFSGMGVGKTKTAIWAFDYLRKESVVKKALVVAPLSILTNVWAREFMVTAPHLKVVVVHGDARKVIRILAQPHDVAIINFDGVKTRFKQIEAMGYDAIIVDEASAYRNATSGRFKALFLLAKEARIVWAMTGTPTPRSPVDGHGLLKLLHPTHPLARSSNKFRDHTMIKVSQFKYVPKPDAAERVGALLQPSVRFTLADVAELPDTVYIDREVSMGPQQRDLYELLRRHAVSESHRITVANSGALLNKLLQVATGAVYRGDGSAVFLDAEERLEALKQIVSEGQRNFLVFVPFVVLAPVVKKALENYATAEGVPLDLRTLTGQTPKNERDTIFSDFQVPCGPFKPRMGIIAQPGAMAHGLTLTEADMAVWYGPVNDLEIYEQANARIVRPGQKHKTLIAHLIGSPAEKRVYAALKKKQQTQETLLEILAQAA